MKFLFKTFCLVLVLGVICKALVASREASSIACADSQIITKLEPMFARKEFRYLITGDKGTKALSNYMSEEETHRRCNRVWSC